MKNSPAPNRSLLWIYSQLWKLARPILSRHSRLRNAAGKRNLKESLPKADIWIQAASVGESFLALELARYLPVQSVLITTNTDQGMEILQKSKSVFDDSPGLPALFPAFFPFDQPRLMEKALKQVAPKVAVLLETELWPGFMSSCKKFDIPLLLANARMSENSFRSYYRFRNLLAPLGPDEILAISAEDAQRYKAVFAHSKVGVMNNIKFDRISLAPSESGAHVHQMQSLTGDKPFIVLGSVREEEEPHVHAIIKAVRAGNPDCVIGLFPRHQERQQAWRNLLAESNIPCELRSKTEKASPGSVILWDTFGELAAAYDHARAIFVGGSLEKLGGQNFVEAAATGVPTFIGPHRKNFLWAGEALMEQGLVTICPSADAVAKALLNTLDQSESHEENKDTNKAIFRSYLQSRSGGTLLAAKAVAKRCN